MLPSAGIATETSQGDVHLAWAGRVNERNETGCVGKLDGKIEYIWSRSVGETKTDTSLLYFNVRYQLR